MAPQRPDPAVTGPDTEPVSSWRNSSKSAHPIVDIQSAFAYVDGVNCLRKVAHRVSTDPCKRSSNRR